MGFPAAPVLIVEKVAHRRGFFALDMADFAAVHKRRLKLESGSLAI
ncbi:hypothetical protein ACFSQQ_39880 [Mesorhizobium kowhaii]